MLEKELLDLFIDPFNWDKKAYKFDRPVKDMAPYSTVANKDNYIIVHNVLGIDKKDLTLSLLTEDGKSYIEIKGKTTDDLTKKVYSVSSRFAVDGTQLDLSTISSSLKNGLLYITINYKKEPEKTNKTININIK